jgi:opine dehydrogenase
MRRIAVIGAGNAGQCIAADCSLAGKEVRLFEFPEFGKFIESIWHTRRIEIVGPQRNGKGFKREGIATIDLVTTDLQEAVKGAGIICISIRANMYESLFRSLIPFLEDGQVITLYPDNFGSLIFRRIMREMGSTKRVVIGGWSSLPYGARILKLSEVNEVYILYRAITLRGDTLPSKDQKKFFEIMKQLPIMDTVDMSAGDTVIDIGFSNVNPILHVPATLLNMGAIDNWGTIFGDSNVFYDIYRHGFSPNVAKVQIALYKEEFAIAEKMGVGIQPYETVDFLSRTSILGQEFMGKGFAIPFEKKIPPEEWMKYLPGERFTVESRYITEDIPVGCRVFYELARKFSIAVPIIESMINLGSVVSEKDYFAEGFSLKDLGIDQMDRDQLLRYLREGDLK